MRIKRMSKAKRWEAAIEVALAMALIAVIVGVGAGMACRQSKANACQLHQTRER